MPLSPLTSQELALRSGSPCELVGLEQEAARQRGVRPRVPGPHGAHGGTGVLGLPHDRRDLVDRLWPVDPQRVARLVAEVVVPRDAALVRPGVAHSGPVRAASRCSTPRSARAAVAFVRVTPAPAGPI